MSHPKPKPAFLNPKFHVFAVAIILIWFLGESIVSSKAVRGVKAGPRFTNPITEEVGSTQGSEFFVFQSGGFYYFTGCFTPYSISIIKSPSLTSWENSTRMTVFNVTAPLTGVIDPELHFIRSDWYIYFEGQATGVSGLRSYVIKSKNPTSPMAEYDRAIKLSSYDIDVWTKDPTILQYEDGELYFVWTSYHNETVTDTRLYIAPMFSPTEISGSRVELRRATMPWESNPSPLLHTPQILTRNGRTFIVFSASRHFDSPVGSLGIMGLDHGRHPLVAENWWHKTDGPIFWGNEAQAVYSPHRAFFTHSPDRSESWILYLARETANSSSTTIRAERFDWDSDGLPAFPRPAGLRLDHKLPSGASVHEKQ